MVRLWKASYYYNSADNFIKKVIEEGLPSELQPLPDTDPDTQQNLGIQFPGQQFEHLLNKTIESLEKSGSSIYYRYDLFVIELATSEGNFMFQYCRNPGLPGKCENCYNRGLMKSQCRCKKAFYCNPSCMAKDEQFHSANCEAVDEVDLNDLNFETEKFARKGTVGL